MQVFVPFFDDFAAIAKCLDSKLLNKQIVEGFQIITGRLSETHKRHPAVLSWSPFFGTLSKYLNELCHEYTTRTGKIHKVQIFLDKTQFIDSDSYVWFLDKCDERACMHILSQRINLLRKDFSHYSQYINMYMFDAYFNEFPEGYYWPVTANNNKLKSFKDSENWKKFCKMKFFLDIRMAFC